MGRRSGKHILSDIDRQAHEIRSTIRDLNKTITKTQKRVDELRHDEAETYLQLAEMRIDLLDDPDVAAQITLAEKEASDTLKNRQKARTTFDKDLKDNQEQQDAIEQKRTTLVSGIEQLYVKVKDAEQAVGAKFPDDPAYNDILGNIEETRNQVNRVENKIALARQDYQEKSKPYHEDELFLYLKTRHYGTSRYKASPLFNTLDDWVAKLTNYEQARRDYTMLHSIPGKLLQHKFLLEQKIEAQEGKLKEYKKEQFKKHGVLALQQTYLEKQNTLDEIDAKLETLEHEHLDILRKKSDLEHDTDEFYNVAISKLRNIYKNKGLHNLRRYVAMTDTRGDDELVNRLYDIERETDKKQSMLSTYTRSMNKETQRLSELQKVRSTYKKRRYDVRRTTFEDSNTFGIMLSNLLVGVLSSRHFWRGVGHIIGEVLDEIEFD